MFQEEILTNLQESIAIIDFGSQVCHLIAKKIRNLGIHSEILPYNITLGELEKQNIVGLILSGGPSSIYETEAPKLSFKLSDIKIPILGICYGHQLLAHEFGGQVVSSKLREYGTQKLVIDRRDKIIKDLEESQDVLMSHGDKIVDLPAGFVAIAATESCEYAVIVNVEKNIFGVQFHPEVTHTPNGMSIFENFLSYCKISKTWDLENKPDEIIKKIQLKIQKPILMAVSGGVDSTVAATLITKAVPDLLYCIFVNNGLLREGEAEEIQKIYTKLFPNFIYVEASELFLERLQGITEPEKKRKIIGNTFIEVFEKQTIKLKSEKNVNFRYLGQGTIYPDRIESSQPSKASHVIKTHHNVGGLPERMNLELIEPLKEFYKDEVRKLGVKLQIEKSLLDRKPFPGPGLAIRILGEVTNERIKVLRKADKILLEELKQSEIWNTLWQAFVVLLPVKTVGVMGDRRTYEEVCALRIISSVNGMTAHVPEIPFSTIQKIANKIVNDVEGINRVVLDVTGKPPATIEWE
jgi:GMP synthase (glutamine-hydrolysing)